MARERVGCGQTVCFHRAEFSALNPKAHGGAFMTATKDAITQKFAVELRKIDDNGATAGAWS
jgi:hypothetical protein